MLKSCIIAHDLVEMHMVTVIGFDPASHRNLGWALIEYDPEPEKTKVIRCISGTFTFQVYEEPWKALGPMSIMIDEFLVKEEPDLVVVEQTSAFRGGFVTGQVSYCIGVLLASCSRNNLDVGFVYPSHVKKILTGKGRATKAQVRNRVKVALKHIGAPVPTKFDSDHASDATGNVLVWMADEDVFKMPEE